MSGWERFIAVGLLLCVAASGAFLVADGGSRLDLNSLFGGLEVILGALSLAFIALLAWIVFSDRDRGEGT